MYRKNTFLKNTCRSLRVSTSFTFFGTSRRYFKMKAIRVKERQFKELGHNEMSRKLSLKIHLDNMLNK